MEFQGMNELMSSTYFFKFFAEEICSDDVPSHRMCTEFLMRMFDLDVSAYDTVSTLLFIQLIIFLYLIKVYCFNFSLYYLYSSVIRQLGLQFEILTIIIKYTQQVIIIENPTICFDESIIYHYFTIV